MDAIPGIPDCLVVKVGGHMIQEGTSVLQTSRWIAGLASHGPVVVVHGGGEDADRLLERLQVPAPKIDGIRLTSTEALPIVAGTLAGTVNLRLVTALETMGVPAVGLTGASHRSVIARLSGQPRGSLGQVGEPVCVDAAFIRSILGPGWVAVFAPLAAGEEGGYLNVNADLFASRIAACLHARLLTLTDVPGVLDKAGKSLPHLKALDVPRLVEDGTITGGMIPKARAAAQAVSEGVPGVWIGTLGPSGIPEFDRGTWVEAAEESDPVWSSTSIIASTPTRPLEGRS